VRLALITKPDSRKSLILVLLVLSIAINYVDRTSLSIAAPSVSTELSLSPTQMGVLLSSFFWSYASFMILAGWLADSYGVRWVLGIGFLVWSLATLATGFATSFGMLLGFRLMLGMGESAAFPSYSKVIATEFPSHLRGFPNALIDAGSKIGPGLGMLVGGFLLAAHGWRMLFFILGVSSLGWLVLWFKWSPRNETPRSKNYEHGPGILEILGKRDALGTFIGNGCMSYAANFLLTWLPSYLIDKRHLSLNMTAIWSAVPFAVAAATSLAAGYLSDRWITGGITPTRVRKGIAIAGLLGMTLMLPLVMVENLRVAIALLIGVYIANGLFSSNYWAITQTLAGPYAAGKWTGLQNTSNSVTALIAPLMTGIIVSKTGSYFLAFLSCAVLAVIGAASYAFIVGPIVPVAWKRSRANTERFDPISFSEVAPASRGEAGGGKTEGSEGVG